MPLTAAAALALLADGWTTIAAAPVSFPASDGMRGRTVLVLPAGTLGQDVAAVYAAVAGEWRTVNGFSGYEPGYYEALRTLSDERHDAVFEPFRANGPLDVLVPEADTLTSAFVARQPGAEVVGADDAVLHYRLPARLAATPEPPLGVTVSVDRLAASCGSDSLPFAIDGDLRTQWVCGPQVSDQELTADLGRVAAIASVVHALGTAGTGFPRELIVETSVTGTQWEPAWRGSPASLVLRAAFAAPRETRVVLPFTPRAARYVRLRQVGRHAQAYWSVSELEVRAGVPSG